LGTAFILYAGANAQYITILLSNSIFKWVGNASYSIYLWHWPLIVFYKLKFSPMLNTKEEIALFFTALLLGFLSWKYIEETMRRGYLHKHNILLVNIMISFIFTISVYTVFHNWHINRVDYKNKVSQYIKHYDTEKKFRTGTCFLTSAQNDVSFFNKDECISWEKGKKNYLLLGDSHAAHYYSTLNNMLHENETLSQVTSSGCLPIMPFEWGSKKCIDLHRWALNDLIPQKHFNTIILSIANIHRTTNEAIKETVNYLLKYTDNVVFLGPTVKYKQSLPRLLVSLPQETDSTKLCKTVGDYNYVVKLDQTLKKLLSIQNVHYVSIVSALSTGEENCHTLTPEGAPIYFDRDHFTESGANYILKQVKNEIFDQE